MKIIIENILSAEIQGLKNVLTHFNNTVIMAHDLNAIYDILHEHKADLIILKAESINHHVREALIEFQTPTIVYGVGEFPDINLQLICVPHTAHPNIINNLSFNNTYILQPFADTLFYQGGVANIRWEADILVSNNYSMQSSVLLKRILHSTNYKVKHIGTRYVKTPSFVGMTTPADFMNLAQSSKVTICDNLTETYSLLANRICAFNETQIDASDSNIGDTLKQYLENEKSRRKYIKEHRADILNRHTVYHRLIDIGDKLKISEWSDKAKTLCKN